MRPIESKERVWQAILHNDRLKQYEEYIRYAREEGYEILPLEEFFLLPDAEKRACRHLILRHDVDHEGVSTRKLFETEKKLGLRSTYYFRDKTIDPELIREMKDAGFEVGYHCETVSHYAWQNGCHTREEVDMDGVRDLFAEELAEFEKKVGFKTRSCCGHGDSICRQMRMTNGMHLADTDLTRFGLLFEAYDRNLYEKFIDVHIMDTELPFHYGFAYADTIGDAIEKGYQNILFLAHPSHWYIFPQNRVRYVYEMLTGKACYSSQRVFRRAFD